MAGAPLRVVDLRSDTVTRPTVAMRAAMAAAEVGDDVLGDDPTVARLEARVAELAGFEAGLFFPSGTQANLCALLAHGARGDEFLVPASAHCSRYEGGGAAIFGGLVPQPVEEEPDGTLDLGKLGRLVKPADDHFAVTRLLCLEDTFHGRVLPRDWVEAAQRFARERGLALHLDGARAWNAAAARGVAVAEVARGFDTVSLCLSKGLGAPVGTVLAGPAALLRRARRWRKVSGGGLRQSGILAAAGLHALDHHVGRIAEDHETARALAAGLATLPGIVVRPPTTNMVFLTAPGVSPVSLVERLRALGVLLLPGAPLRLVSHLDVRAEDVPRVVDAFSRALAP
ncbi:MAG: low-specificity L-threonine aldolase [Deltaproteobacteria bacterium]|nr:low-specificity L-threonine aldolase [Deltaproteobacteria bacterium]